MVEEYAARDQSTTTPLAGPTPGTRDALTEILRDGAKRAGMSLSAFQGRDYSRALWTRPRQK
jgi:hypothetical protein